MSDYIVFFLFLLLYGLVVFQQWYWSRQVQVLVDKLMSRNYAEYNLVNQSPELPKVKETVLDFDDDKVLEELNGMIGP